MRKFKPKTKLSREMTDEEKKSYHLSHLEDKSVLGIDIYKYSSFPLTAQVYIPVLFNFLYEETVRMCLQVEEFFFQNYTDSLQKFKNHFISTGDGGFQIFDNPLQSIIFASYFQFNVTRFNSDGINRIFAGNLFEIIGAIELRYAITYNKLYLYEGNYYGAGIINNSRILAKDSLNRLLLDHQTIKWFHLETNTIENLIVIQKSDLLKIDLFTSYDKTKKTLLFDTGESNGIRAVNLLKIGEIKSKNTVLEIFNLNIQVYLAMKSSKKSYKNFLITLGNLNTQGID